MTTQGLLQQRCRTKSQAAKGQALVEMAMVMMIMLTITVASIDFGIYMFRYVQAANCVREAARRAVVRDPSAANPPYCVDAALPAPTITPAGYQTAAQGTEVVASISVPYNWLALDTFIPGLTGAINASTSMRMEGQVVT